MRLQNVTIVHDAYAVLLFAFLFLMLVVFFFGVPLEFSDYAFSGPSIANSSLDSFVNSIRYSISQIQTAERGLFKGEYVTTADSRDIQKDRNDLSNPGAQRRVGWFYARRENSFITGG